MTSNRERRLVLEDLKRKYTASVPRARLANSTSSLVDILVRQQIYLRPRLSYREALTAVLASDPELKAAYANE